MDTAVGFFKRPWSWNSAKLFCNRQTGLEAIFMKAVSEVGTAKPRVVRSLKAPESLLVFEGVFTELRMIVEETA